MKIIPESRKREAMDHIRQRLESGGDRDNITMQEYYSEIVKVMKEAVEKYGKLKGEITTNDKISRETKDIISRREVLRRKSTKTGRDIVELAELRKTIKREVRRDIKKYDEEVTCEIIERYGSTKRLWKELKKEQDMVTNLKSKEGKSETDTKRMIMVASEFYEKLYGRDGGKGEGGKHEGEKGGRRRGDTKN